MQTKTTQEQTIEEYKTKQTENEGKIKKLSKELEENHEKLQSAEQVFIYWRLFRNFLSYFNTHNLSGE